MPMVEADTYRPQLSAREHLENAGNQLDQAQLVFNLELAPSGVHRSSEHEVLHRLILGVTELLQAVSRLEAAAKQRDKAG